MYKYGMLEKIGNRENKYKLRCDCGNIVYRSPSSLSSSLSKGYNPNCGCSKNKIEPEFIGLKSSNIKKGSQFSITEKQFKIIKSRNCYYCGFSETFVSKLNNSNEFTFDNAIAICECCQIARGKMDHENFLIWLRRILSFSKVRDFGLEGVKPIDFSALKD